MMIEFFKKAYSYYEMQLQGALTDLKKDLKLVGLFEVVQCYTTPSQTVTLGMHTLYTSKTISWISHCQNGDA